MNPGKILVVDDTPANLSLLLDTLAQAGHDVLVAESGRSALSTFDHNPPDIVLLDVVMPGLDGYETCQLIKARPIGARVPILFMTARDEPEEKVRAFNAGAVDYITKPIYPPEVLARVATHLDIRHLQRDLEEELAMRVEAENLLGHSLDLAVVLVDDSNRIVFSSRLADALLHKYFPSFDRNRIPDDLETGDSGLLVRHFSDGDRRDLRMLIMEESTLVSGPGALMSLGLTSREAEVLYWIAQGKSNPDVATIIETSVRTVHKHVENIFRKLGLETRNAAALTALEVLRPTRS
ncbi:MAG: response regulator [Cephaloticoccus sp.]|nr:response regulator [Cephaloticoccus sp.]MCF7760693.1 response regulator [Cephaloticoccus sp.]